MRSSVVVLLAGWLLAPASHAESTPYPDPTRYQDVILDFVAEDAASGPIKDAVVATGSSSMRGWHKTIKQDLAPLAIIPRGFGGSNINDVQFYLDDLVLKHEPAKVLLYEGDNDVALGASPDVILEKTKDVLDSIRTLLPTTHVYLLYVKPSIARWQMWPTMQEVNRGYQEICDRDSNVSCIDVASPMLNEDGEPKPEIFVDDKLHMNDKGYRLWTEAARAVLFRE